MQLLTARNFTDRPEPDMTGRTRPPRREQVPRLHNPEFEWPGLVDETPHALAEPPEHLRRRPRGVGEGLRGRHVGHRDLMIEAILVDLERGGHVEDRLAVLNGHDPPVGKT